MAEVVYGDQATSAPLQHLARMLQAADFSGTLYIGYPILTNIEGTVRVDALYVAQDAGVVLFDAAHLNLNADDANEVAELERAQNRFFAAIQLKLLETPELLVKRSLAVPITVISLSMNINLELGEALLATPEHIPEIIPSDANLSAAQYKILNSVIERTATIRPRKRRANVRQINSRGAILKELEQQIANLDAWQKKGRHRNSCWPAAYTGGSLAPEKLLS
jgi:superfamily I DNA and RNA helicase